MRPPSLRTLYHRTSSLALAWTNFTSPYTSISSTRSLSTSLSNSLSNNTLTRLLTHSLPPPAPLSLFKQGTSPRRAINISSIPLVGSLFGTSSTSPKGERNMGSNASTGKEYPVQKPESEWQAVLSPEQFRVIREKGTEAPFTGEYDKHMPSQGVYKCAACETPLYTAQHKFKSGCGWPAYFDSIPGAVERHTDRTFGMARTEIACAKCGGHLGHVFKGEGYPTPTDERHCVNSVSLRFTADDPAGK